MARPLRIQYENAVYHVTCRGNDRQDIFADGHDRLRFLSLLQRSSRVYQVSVVAFVLMKNHFHLLVRTPGANLQEFMRHPFLATGEVLDLIHDDRRRAKRAYHSFVEGALASSLPSPLEKGRGHGIVGEKGFLEKVKAALAPAGGSRRVGELEGGLGTEQ